MPKLVKLGVVWKIHSQDQRKGLHSAEIAHFLHSNDASSKEFLMPPIEDNNKNYNNNRE